MNAQVVQELAERVVPNWSQANAYLEPPLANRQADVAAEHLAESVRDIDEVTVDDRRAVLDSDMITNKKVRESADCSAVADHSIKISS